MKTPLRVRRRRPTEAQLGRALAELRGHGRQLAERYAPLPLFRETSSLSVGPARQPPAAGPFYHI